MYRKVEDFLNDWKVSSEGTLKVIESVTDEKLNQAIVEGHSTLGWIGWHLTSAPAYFAGLLGLTVFIPGDYRNVPDSAKEIAEGYKKVSSEFMEKVKDAFTDEDLTVLVDMHGTETPRGQILRTAIDHQTHHRGQMTVLLRQAGLKVPGVMGPTKEDLQQ